MRDHDYAMQLEGAVADLTEEVGMHKAYLDDVLTDMRNLMAFSLCAGNQYARTNGPVIPEMEGLSRLVDVLGDKPEYLPTTWCFPAKDHHVTPHRGCILR